MHNRENGESFDTVGKQEDKQHLKNARRVEAGAKEPKSYLKDAEGRATSIHNLVTEVQQMIDGGKSLDKNLPLRILNVYEGRKNLEDLPEEWQVRVLKIMDNERLKPLRKKS